MERGAGMGSQADRLPAAAAAMGAVMLRILSGPYRPGLYCRWIGWSARRGSTEPVEGHWDRGQVTEKAGHKRCYAGGKRKSGGLGWHSGRWLESCSIRHTG